MALTEAERTLTAEASAWFDAHRNRFIDELCELLSLPSVADESDPDPAPGAPYGPEVRRVFDHMLAKAADDGFPTHDYEGHVMEVSYPQENTEHDDDIAFVGHLDVVPAGDGWTHDAFSPQVVGDTIVGRGALDNKGAALVNYTVLRFFKDHGHRFRHRVRALFGGSEEIALNDIKWFVAHVGAPHQAIVTDGPFPVNNIQKGLLDVDVALPAGPVLAGWRAGSSANTIPGAASIVLPGFDETAVRRALDAASGDGVIRGGDADTAASLVVTPVDAGTQVEALGISGHASQPDGTVNAIALLAGALADSGLLRGVDLTTARAIARWAGDPYGSGLGIAFDNAESGPTTVNGGTIVSFQEFLAEYPGDDVSSDRVRADDSGTDDAAESRRPNDEIVLHFDIRFAVGQTQEEILASIRERAETVGGRIVRVLGDDPYYVPADDPRVELLTRTYDDVLDCDARPMAMGGGTHARFIPNALNFGPEFHAAYVPAADGIALEAPAFIRPGTGSAHGADEWASLKNLKTAFVLYVLGLDRLDRYLDGSGVTQPN